jgi:hypothetical protein
LDLNEFAQFLLRIAVFLDVSGELDKKGLNDRFHPDEFKEIFPQVSRIIGAEKRNIEECDAIFQSMDRNGDGVIALQDLCLWATDFKLENQSSTTAIRKQQPLHGSPAKKILPLETVSQWTPEQLQECFLRFDASNQNGM